LRVRFARVSSRRGCRLLRRRVSQWQACWPTRNFRLPIPTSPRRFWCPAFTARADANAEEKSYFGADASQYDQRSAFPGILNIKTPLLLAWSTQDPPRLVACETLKQRLCNPTTHCPRTTVLGNRESLASVFEASASSGGLAPPTLELVREIEARGLP
jgi:hypothetical protein